MLGLMVLDFLWTGCLPPLIFADGQTYGIRLAVYAIFTDRSYNTYYFFYYFCLL